MCVFEEHSSLSRWKGRKQKCCLLTFSSATIKHSLFCSKSCCFFFFILLCHIALGHLYTCYSFQIVFTTGEWKNWSCQIVLPFHETSEGFEELLWVAKFSLIRDNVLKFNNKLKYVCVWFCEGSSSLLNTTQKKTPVEMPQHDYTTTFCNSCKLN